MGAIQYMEHLPPQDPSVNPGLRHPILKDSVLRNRAAQANLKQCRPYQPPHPTPELSDVIQRLKE